MGAVGYRFRADRGLHWRGWVLRGLLFGVAMATVMAAAGAARRTDSAYSRFVASQDAWDVLIANDGEGGLAVLDPADVISLPQVSDSVIYHSGYAAVGTGESTMSDVGNRIGRDINRFKILEGRTFDPDREDEAVVSFALADRYGLEVGDEISLFGETGSSEDAFEIVGIEASPGEFPPQFVGSGMVHLSPAVAREAGGGAAIMLQLENGPADASAFVQALSELADGAPIDATLQQEGSTETQRSIHLQAVAFWILAVVLLVPLLAMPADRKSVV